MIGLPLAVLVGAGGILAAVLRYSNEAKFKLSEYSKGVNPDCGVALRSAAARCLDAGKG